MQLIRGALIPNILQISLWSYQGAASFHMRWRNTKLRGMRGYCWGRHLRDSTSAASSLYITLGSSLAGFALKVPSEGHTEVLTPKAYYESGSV